MARKNSGKRHREAFLPEEEIEFLFREKSPRTKSPVDGKPELKMWYKAGEAHPLTYNHNDGIGPNKDYDYDNLADEWYKWFLRTPAPLSVYANPDEEYGEDDRNTLSFPDKDAFVYFGAAAPFRNPDVRRIIMTNQLPLFLPIYNVAASLQQFPSAKNEKNLLNLIKNDLHGIKPDSIEAKLDGRYIYGRCVMRDKPIPISGIPKNNIFDIEPENLFNKQSGLTIDLYHGGLWLLIKELSPGDHLLYFKVESVNYEMETKFVINAYY
jgi:hypothetical protein